MRLKNPKFGLTPEIDHDSISFLSDQSRLSIVFVTPHIARIRHTPFAGKPQETNLLSPDLPNAIPITIKSSEDVWAVDAGEISVSVQIKDNDLTLGWTATSLFLEDLPYKAYEIDLDTGATHHLRHTASQNYYGLGEKTSSSLSLAGRSYNLSTSDSMGYNAETTDPLYKHIPFYISLTGGVAYGIFYNTASLGKFDFGSEIDGAFGSYSSFRSNSAHLDYFVIYGPSVERVVEGFGQIVCFPALIPRYGFGYLASAMGYAESSNAQELIMGFPGKLEKYDIPCDVLHLSSGYTVDAVTGQRNVFTWNYDRFPNPVQLFNHLKSAGIHTVANVKPWLLVDHPLYAQACREKVFIMDPETQSPSLTRLWSAGPGQSANGSYIDFASSAGRSFWKNNICKLLSVGITGIWVPFGLTQNDNNEFSGVNDDNWIVGNSTVRNSGRANLTLLMAVASYEAIQESMPTDRPFLISRAGTAGISKLTSTWSGDNKTSWHTLKHNIPMGLHAGLSLMANYGHDVGGFVGEMPGPELFLRWVQSGVLHPRFCIHSWKSGGISEPWMYLEVLDFVRDAIKFRYKIIPYLYSLSLEANQIGHPIIRPLLYHFQSDSKTHDLAFEYMLGPSLLVASVYEQGKVDRTLYLPKGLFYDLFQDVWYEGGETITVPVPLSQPGAVFVMAGAMIPINPNSRPNTALDDARHLWLFPTPGKGKSVVEVMDDDGISAKSLKFIARFEMEWDEDSVSVNLRVVRADWTPAYSHYILKLPKTDLRTLSTSALSTSP